MENPTPFDLNAAIRRWQQNLATSPAFKADNLEELASHLRASVQKLVATGLSDEEAFLIATRRIGERGLLEREFGKVNLGMTSWLPVVLFWIVTCIFLLRVAWLLVRSIDILLFGLQRGGFRVLGGVAGHALRLLTPNNPSFLDYRYWDRYWAIEWSVVLVVVFILVARLATGSWKGIGAFIRYFEHPIRTGLGLVLLGSVLSFLPALLICFLTRNEFGQYAYVAAMAAANFVLVVSMVLLARWGLCKMSPAGGPQDGRAMNCPYWKEQNGD